MSLAEEVDLFIEQMLDKYEEVNKKFGGKHFVRDTWLEPYMRNNLRDFYLQLKFICEKLRRDIILKRKLDYDRSLTVFRRGQILQKIMFKPWFELDKIGEYPYFVWQDHKEMLIMEEYIDIILSEISSLFEYYFYNLQNNITFNCVELARNLRLTSVLSHIKKANSLKQLYNKLSFATNKAYGVKTNSLFPSRLYDVRCAVFHMDYYYNRSSSANFEIYLDARKTKKIEFDELIELTRDVIAKINIIKIVPNFFAMQKI